MATSTETEREEKREPNSQYASAVIDSEGELQDCVSCVYCGDVNPLERERCKACGEALGGRPVERRLLIGRISTYASHIGQSKRGLWSRQPYPNEWFIRQYAPTPRLNVMLIIIFLIV